MLTNLGRSVTFRLRCIAACLDFAQCTAEATDHRFPENSRSPTEVKSLSASCGLPTEMGKAYSRRLSPRRTNWGCTASRRTKPIASVKAWVRSPAYLSHRRDHPRRQRMRAPMRSIRVTGFCQRTPIWSRHACVANGIIFIGPKAETMRALGDKASSARRVAIEAGVPVIPATDVLGDDFDAIKPKKPRRSAIR